MQRQILGAALLALVAVSAGCNPSYVAGRCDCQYNPANAVIAPASNPYPVIGANAAAGTVPAASAPALMPMTVPPVAVPPATTPMTIPPATTGK